MNKGLRILLVICVATAAGCSRSKSNIVNKKGEPIISDQFDTEEVKFPKGEPLFVTLIQLKNPALLSQLKVDANGKKSVDPALKAAITEEQQQLESALKKISPDVQVLYRYHMVLNALAVEAPQKYAEQINNLDVQYIEADERFSLPKINQEEKSLMDAIDIVKNNSITFIGAGEVHDKLKVKDTSGQLVPVRGQGIKVGVIDTGIDYTHKMLGGSGDVGIFKSINSDGDTNFFPTTRVVGGYDFVGGRFDTRSPIYTDKVPNPDKNPLDRSGHGTHVSGTIGGRGDGVNTYDGAAPDVDLYALKVFGDNGGSTNDTSIIAALEYAADPNGDMDPSDHLNVVNLSLGGDYGKPHSLYNEAITNLTIGGTLASMSAGNSGAVPSIVGAPSTADDALSVAASVDGMFKNWHFPAVQFTMQANPKVLAEAVEGAITKPIKDVGNIQGKLVYIGVADQDLSVDQLATVKGNVALIDRGAVSFADKIRRATGATGIVMVNNDEKDPFIMGGDPKDKFDIPGIMISKALGQVLKDEMVKGDVRIQFFPQEFIAKPELVDNIVSFSSQGPRLIDSAIKPEITAPGYAIISAAMGSGDKGVAFSGTSMAAPHITGVAALLMQYRPHLSARQIKALLMNNSVLIKDNKGMQYPVSRQGAGRVNIYRAATAGLVFSEPALSLGEVQVDTTKSIVKTLTVENTGDSTASYYISAVQNPYMKIALSSNQVVLNPGEARNIDASILIDATTTPSVELNAFIEIRKDADVVGHIPALAIVNKLTQMHLVQLNVKASDAASSAGADVEATLVNEGFLPGSAYLFNLLGKDARKPLVLDSSLNYVCDLESVGYRVIERDGEKFVQLAIKIYNPVNTWSLCDVNVSFDFNKDQQSEIDLIGTQLAGLPGFAEANVSGFYSAIFNTAKLNQIIDEYRKQLAAQTGKPVALDFKPALISAEQYNVFDHSTIGFPEIKLKDLPSSQFDVQVVVSANGGETVEVDDTLQTSTGNWVHMDVSATGGAYVGMPEEVNLNPGESQTYLFKKGSNVKQDLVTYFPRNAYVMDLLGQDTQSEIKPPQYAVGVANP
ncbi:MAG: S8 family serine peptidase [Bdellovibrionaceae bacterium]|nr:S8 family serine peptidase [Pseudobdellovibrionaceae bacterium]